MQPSNLHLPCLCVPFHSQSRKSTHFHPGPFRAFFCFVTVEFSSGFPFLFPVAHQDYRVDVHLESVIQGNDVIFGCNVQSFITDFVFVTGWLDSEGGTHLFGSTLHGNWNNFQSITDLYL